MGKQHRQKPEGRPRLAGGGANKRHKFDRIKGLMVDSCYVCGEMPNHHNHTDAQGRCPCPAHRDR